MRMLHAYWIAYQTRPHRWHGSASEDQVASVPTNRSISFDYLSLSRFPLKMIIDPDVTVLLSRLFQLLITRSEKKWCLIVGVRATAHGKRSLITGCDVNTHFAVLSRSLPFHRTRNLAFHHLAYFTCQMPT